MVLDMIKAAFPIQLQELLASESAEEVTTCQQVKHYGANTEEICFGGCSFAPENLWCNVSWCAALMIINPIRQELFS